MKKRFVVAVTVLLSVLTLSSCGAKGEMMNGLRVIDVRDYVSVTFSGVDTLGTAEMTVDYDGLTVCLHGEDYTEWDRDTVEFDIEVRAENPEGLSNGDTFTVSVTADNLALYGCCVKETALSYTVEGLEEMDRVDVFRDLEISYDGTCPYVKATVSNPSMDLFIQSVRYEVSPDWFDEGGTVTVRAVYDEETARRYGCVAEENELQFVAEGLSYYVAEPAQISEDCMRFMLENGPAVVEEALSRKAFQLSQAVVEEFIAYPVASCERAVPTGELLFFHSKEKAGNFAVMPYEVTYTLQDGNEWIGYEEVCSGTVYIGVTFRNLRVDADGTVSVSNFDKFATPEMKMTGFDLEKDAIYEKLLESCREDYVCYEKIPFEVGS